jgi:hypothetical protein
MNKNPFIKLLEIYKKSNKPPNTNEISEVLIISEVLKDIPGLSKFNMVICENDDTILFEYKHRSKSTGLVYNRTFCTIILGRPAGDVLFTFGERVKNDFKDLYNELSKLLIKEYGFSHDYFETFVLRLSK